MPCFNGCNNGCNNYNGCNNNFLRTARQNCDYDIVYKNSPYPVYPCPNPITPVRFVENNNIRRELSHIFKGATIGNEEVFRNSPIPFNFNVFGNKSFIEHFPHDNNFLVHDEDLYQVIYKLNFTPSDNGVVSLVLRQNGTSINETLIILNVLAQNYYSISFDDYLKIEKDTTIDLLFMETSTTTAITVVNPYIIFKKVVE